MKKFVLAALAAMTLGLGVASAAPSSNVLDSLTHNRLPSPEFTYSAGNG